MAVTGAIMRKHQRVSATELTDSQQKEYHDAFRMFDKDQSGFITTRELKSLMRSLGCNPTDSELQEIVNKVDADGNGQIDLPEFITLMINMSNPDEELATTKDAFNVFDTEGKGVIYTQQMREVIISTLTHEVPKEELNDMLECAGLVNDRNIMYEEFAKLIITNGFITDDKDKVNLSTSNLDASFDSAES